MKKYLLLAAAGLAVASPAAARDGSGYIGLEGGILFPNNTDVDVNVTADGETIADENNAFEIDYNTGYDIDLVGGYDFGMFRLEAELGLKRSSLDDVDVDDSVLDAINDEFDLDLTQDDLDLGGHARVVSGMINGLVDLGNENGVNGFLGAGIGLAGVKYSAFGDSDSDSAFAWQLLAGVRAPISENIDLGLKYRYFHTGDLHFNDSFDFDDVTFGGRLSGHYSSHSLLASLVYNFGAVAAAPPPPPPPPPPAAPATQTCADGSVILATDACPLPPAPPPPPPPANSGERGR